MVKFFILAHVRIRKILGLKLYNKLAKSYPIQALATYIRRRDEVVQRWMQVSKAFFSTNMDRVQNIVSWLIDDISRNVYLKMIEVRRTADYRKLPKTIDVEGQYFYNEYFKFGENEVFVDCGAYDGNTITRFTEAVMESGGSVKRIVAFEPGDEQYMKLTKEHKDITIFKAGVWSNDETLSFDGWSIGGTDFAAGGGGRGVQLLNVESVVTIPVRAIDNCPECEGVTLLKMDIEGAELPALKGAYNTIKKYKPRLAISIYHTAEEMVTIPEWVHRNFPEYKLFVRQHEYGINETVMYGFV